MMRAECCAHHRCVELRISALMRAECCAHHRSGAEDINPENKEKLTPNINSTETTIMTGVTYSEGQTKSTAERRPAKSKKEQICPTE